MNTIKNICCIIALSALLMACHATIPMQRLQTASLVRGMDSAQVHRVLGKATLVVSYPFESQGQRFRADHYTLLTGTRQQMVTRCASRRRGCVPTLQYIPVTDSYVVIYLADSDKVYSWGTVEELSRSPDDAISDIMPALKAAYSALPQR